MFRLLSSVVEAVLGGEDDYFDLTTAQDLVEVLKAGNGVSAGRDGLRPTAQEDLSSSNPPTESTADPTVLHSLGSGVEAGSRGSDAITEEEAMLDFDTDAEAMLDFNCPTLEADIARREPDALYYAVFNNGTLDHVYGHMSDSKNGTSGCARVYYPDTSSRTSTKQEIKATVQKSFITFPKSLKEIMREVGPPDDGQSIVFEDLVEETMPSSRTKQDGMVMAKSNSPDLAAKPVSRETLRQAAKDTSQGAKRPQGHKRTVSAPEPTKKTKKKKGSKKITPQETASVQPTTVHKAPSLLVAASVKEQTSSKPDTASSSPTLVPSTSPSLVASSLSSVPSSPSKLTRSAPCDVEPPRYPASKSKWWSWLLGPDTLTSSSHSGSNGITGPAELTRSDVAKLPALLGPNTLTKEEPQGSLSVVGPSSLTEIPKRRRGFCMLALAQTATDAKEELKWTTNPNDLGISKTITAAATAPQKKAFHSPQLQPAGAQVGVQISKNIPSTKTVIAADSPSLVEPARHLLSGPQCIPPLSASQKLNMTKGQRQRYNRKLRREQEAAHVPQVMTTGQQAVTTIKRLTKEAIESPTVDPARAAILHEVSEKALRNMPLEKRQSFAQLPFKVCIKSTIEAYSYASMVYAPHAGPLQQEFGPHNLVLWTDGTDPLHNASRRLQAFAVIYRHNPLTPGQETLGWEEWAYTANIGTPCNGTIIDALEATAVHTALGISIGEVDRRLASPNPIKKLTVLTDSQNTLCNLLTGTLGPLGDSMIRYGKTLATKGVTVELRWVPSHAAVPGNEAADRLALLASQFGPVPEEGALIRVPVPLLRMCQKQLALAEVFSRGENPNVLKPYLWMQKQELREALGRACLDEGWGRMMADPV